jgi:hypothetical protein
LDVGEAAQLATTAFAAIAAVGSAGAAWVMYRQWSAASTPALSIDLSETQPSGAMFLTIVSYGGPVKKASIAVVEGEQACLGFVPPHGFVAAGERVRLGLPLDSSGNTKQVAVVYGFDLQSRYVYAWAASGRSERWPARSRRFRGAPTDLSAVEILKRFYAGAPDPTTLEQRAVALMQA